MKIREDYLSFLFDEFKRDNQEMRTYGEVLNKIILFESTDFMKAMHIAKEALDNEGSRSVPGPDLSLVNILIADRP
jgi:hypothetical protein